MRHDGHPHSPHLGAPVRVAVVGAGHFGELHARAYAANPDCELVAIVDRNLDRAQTVAANFNGAAAYTSVDDLVAHQSIDAASVVTAGPHHLEPTLRALNAGASVLLEKPVVVRSEDGRTLREAAASARGFVMPAHILRFAAPYQELRHRLRSGAIGAPRALSFRRHRTIEHDRLFPDIHPVLTTMVHDIDLALWLTGDVPGHATARQLSLEGRHQPTVVWAEVETIAGAIWSFQASWSLGDEGGLPDALEVIGEMGALTLSLGARVHERGSAASVVDDVLTPAGSHGALDEEIRIFVDGVRFGAAPEVVRLDEALAGLDLAERIIIAAQQQEIASRESRERPSGDNNQPPEGDA